MQIDQTDAEQKMPGRRMGVVLAVLAIGAVGVLTIVCVRFTDGRLVYALDDAYIHLAMGRTVAESGVWGLNAETAGAASSSPLWTLLLAGATLIFGSQTWLPLALNLLAAGALALAADLWLRTLHISVRWRVAAVIAMIIIGPVGPLAMTGMEHIAHAASVVLLVALVVRDRPAGPLAIALAAALATGFRYESAFVAAALMVVMGLRREWTRTVALFIGPTLVITVVGIAQVAGGQSFLPNSLVVKAAPVTLPGLGEWVRWKAFAAMEHAFEAPVVALPLLAFVVAWAAAARGRTAASPTVHRAALESSAALALAMLAQVILASTGWYHRYEAYLLIWAVLSVFVSARAWRRSGGRLLPRGDCRGIAAVGGLGVALLLTLALGIRIQAWQTAPEACLDIASQHAEMARFVARYYPDEPLVLNDVGYVSYVSHGPILDLGGLASHEVAEARASSMFDAEWVEREVRERGIRIGINYDLAVIPASWDVVASWHTGATHAAGLDTVHFYAIDPGVRDELLANLRDFEDSLHARVSVEYPGVDDA